MTHRAAQMVFSEPLPSQWSTEYLLDRSRELAELQRAVSIAQRDLEYASALLDNAGLEDKRKARNAVRRARAALRRQL